MTTESQPRKKTARKPTDHKPKALTNAQRVEALDAPVTFDFDGDSFTVKPRDATGLEFMAALEDEELIVACRLLLGRDQATRLFKGRDVEDLAGFFDVMGEAVKSGNR